MAVANLTSFLTALEDPHETLPVSIIAATGVVGRWTDTWSLNISSNGGGTQNTATLRQPNRTTAGALGQVDAATGSKGVLHFEGGTQAEGVWMLVDRLADIGNLNSNSTGLQTAVVTPTRYTDGAGVMAYAVPTTQVGATAGTISITYTNQAGVGGRVSPLVQFGATSFREVNRVIWFPLQSGDTGIRSIQSCTLGTSTAGAGPFSIVMVKPIWTFISDRIDRQVVADMISGQAVGGPGTIVAGAALQFLYCSSANSNTQAYGQLSLAEY